MPPARLSGHPMSRSHSENHHDDDDDSSRGDSMPPDLEGDGKGKGGHSSQTRKAQNRLAQREFRLRKQQYIRDLEARVEILSGDKEERAELMILLIRNLLKENKDLRNMVKTMASFVGEGLGSCLPRLGLSAPQLDAILNRADTDTAYDAFLTLKASKEMEEANPGIQLGTVRRKSSGKRKRDETEASASAPITTPDDSNKNTKLNTTISPPATNNTYDYLFPDLEAFANNRYPNPFNPYLQQPTQFPPMTAAGLLSLPDPSQAPNYLGFPPQQPFSGFGVTAPVPTLPMSSYAGGMADNSQSHNRYDYQTQFQTQPAPVPAPAPKPAKSDQLSEEDKARDKRLKDAIANLTDSDRRVLEGEPMTADEMQERLKVQERLMQSLPDTIESNRMLEAMQMITYHLNNFRVNHNYVLPPSLRPTKVQRTIAHEHAIDGIVFPSIRDRMILLRGRYDLVEAFHGIINQFRLNGEDPLDHTNWEVSERWMTEFRMLVDAEVYEVTNRWRSRRGDPPLQMIEMASGL